MKGHMSKIYIMYIIIYYIHYIYKTDKVKRKKWVNNGKHPEKYFQYNNALHRNTTTFLLFDISYFS